MVSIGLLPFKSRLPRSSSTLHDFEKAFIEPGFASLSVSDITPVGLQPPEVFAEKLLNCHAYFSSANSYNS